MAIFDSLGSVFGYVLWFLYIIVQNYGLAIILFTILIRAAIFPLNLRQQRSMAATAKLSDKQKELQKKYGDDKQKYQEELQKLYDQEGAKPGSGCLISILPFFFMIGIYYSIINPLSNALHLADTTVARATSLLTQIPGAGTSLNTRYVQLEVVKNFDFLKPYLGNVWSANEIADVDKFSHSFNFLGLDLLQTPWGGPAVLWIIPILCLLIAVGTQIYSMFTNDAMKNQQGCMKVFMLLLPLLTAYLALTLPGAVGFYWVVSNIMTFFQTVVTNKVFNKDYFTANKEARHIALREMEEKAIVEIPVSERRVITKESVQNQGRAVPNNTNNNTSKKKRKKK